MAVAAAAAADGTHVFLAEWDASGVRFYQAFDDPIAEWALAHQRFGGPLFDRSRMTWIKPSFAWVLYRSGYGSKHCQTRVLKVTLPHEVVARLLAACKCAEGGRGGGGGAKGRVQWDPARDLMAAEGRVPRRMLRQRAIQIGLAGSLSELYVESVLAVEDVTPLARAVGAAHGEGSARAVAAALAALSLPLERPYVPRCDGDVLHRLRIAPAEAAAGGEMARSGGGERARAAGEGAGGSYRAGDGTSG